MQHISLYGFRESLASIGKLGLTERIHHGRCSIDASEHAAEGASAGSRWMNCEERAGGRFWETLLCAGIRVALLGRGIRVALLGRGIRVALLGRGIRVALLGRGIRVGGYGYCTQHCLMHYGIGIHIIMVVWLFVWACVYECRSIRVRV